MTLESSQETQLDYALKQLDNNDPHEHYRRAHYDVSDPICDRVNRRQICHRP
jgi:hypothetical protein